MVMKELVADVNRELTLLIEECQFNHENPRLIRLAEQLHRLTNIADDAGADNVTTAQPQAEMTTAQEQINPATCAHKILNIYGVCSTCGKCQHTQVRDGFCITCGEEMPEAPAQGVTG